MIIDKLGGDFSGEKNTPFISQNQIIGNEYAETGLLLDNANGKLEHNVITEFYYSYFSFYSSPNMLKNTFDNSYDDNMFLTSSSVPVMKPIISEGSTYWYSGDNKFTGTPSDAGIVFGDDAYPDMNYGYNCSTITGSTYYINGVNPTGAGEDFFVRGNSWGETPVSNKFYVDGADVEYASFDDCSSGARETNNMSLYDIGFGLKDTVYFYDSDNPSAQDLYLEAYQKEYSGEFIDAIDAYKRNSRRS